MNIDSSRKHLLFKSARTLGAPAYVYFTDQIMENISVFDSLRNLSFFKLNYAVKANPNINILRIMLNQGMGLDVVSPGELDLALELGFKKDRIYFTPSNAPEEEIHYAFQKNIIPILDHIHGLKFVAHGYSDREIGIRINPAIEDGAYDKIQVGGKASKFGLPFVDLKEVSQIAENNQLRVVILHAHVGSELSGLSSFKRLLHLFEQYHQLFPSLKAVNIGGGYPVNYSSEELMWNPSELYDILEKFHNKMGLQILTEPGKFLVSNAGFYVCDINRVKSVKNTHYICLNGGFNHFIRPMYYQARHRVLLYDEANKNSDELRDYKIVGNICEKDEFGHIETKSIPQENGMLAFCNAGAYGYSMASNYNLRFLPREIIVHKGAFYEVTRPDRLSDILNKQKSIDLS